jgi:hypothetical protein
MKHKVKHVHFIGIGGERLNHPARDPRSGIDGKAMATSRLRTALGIYWLFEI